MSDSTERDDYEDPEQKLAREQAADALWGDGEVASAENETPDDRQEEMLAALAFIRAGLFTRLQRSDAAGQGELSVTLTAAFMLLRKAERQAETEWER